MKVLLLVYYPDSLTYTVARAVASGAHEVTVLSIANANNKWDMRIRKRLTSVPGVQLLEQPADVSELSFDWLICQLHPRFIENTEEVIPPLPKVGSISAFSLGDKKISYKAALRKQALEIWRFPAIFLKARRILYKDGFYCRDIYSLIKKKGVIGFDPHSMFLNDINHFGHMFDSSWAPDDNRAISVGFAGSQDPMRRRKILDQVRPLFVHDGNEQLAKPAGGNKDKQLYWHEYTDADGGNLTPNEFVDVLTNSDYTLCPPGHYLLTHRPVEALIRGSIPILNEQEMEIYDMSLRDGINCIAVSNNDWRGCVERVMSIDEGKIREMRRNIKGMEDRYLTDQAISRSIRERLGIT